MKNPPNASRPSRNGIFTCFLPRSGSRRLALSQDPKNLQKPWIPLPQAGWSCLAPGAECAVWVAFSTRAPESIVRYVLIQGSFTFQGVRSSEPYSELLGQIESRIEA